MKEVTDPALLAQLNRPEVTDPALLAQLNGGPTEDQSPAETRRLAASAPAPNPVADVLLGIGDVARGSKNVLNRTLRGLSGGYLGSPEQTVPEGKQAGDYAGEIATDVALAAAPLSKASKLVDLLRGTKAAAITIPAANIAANAGYSAATTDKDRITAAGWGAGGAALGAAANRVASGLVRPGAYAQQLLNQGVDLTPGQAGSGVMGRVARFSEDAAGSIPVAGRPVNAAQESALKQWNALQIAKTQNVPGKPVGKLGEAGHTGIKDAQKSLGKEYKEFYPESAFVKLDDADQLKNLKSSIESYSGNLPPSKRGEFEASSEWLVDQLKTGFSASQWKEIVENELGALAKAAKRDGSYSLQTAYQRLELDLKHLYPELNGSPVSGNAVGRLGDLNRRYRDLMVLRDAASKAGPIRREGIPYPSEVAVRAFKTGAGNLQDEALQAQKLFGTPPAPRQGLTNTMKALATAAVGAAAPAITTIPPAAVALLATFPQGRKVLLGQYPLQKLLAENPELAMQLARAMSTQGASNATSNE